MSVCASVIVPDIGGSGVTPVGQGWTNARGLQGLGGSKPDLKSDAAQKLDIDSIIDKFANTKARVAKFN